MTPKTNYRVLLFSMGLLLCSTLFAGGAAKVTTVVGKATANDRPLARGDEVAEAEVVTTEANSKVKLLLEDGSVLDVGPNSSIVITGSGTPGKKPEEASVDVLSGSLRSVISKGKEKNKKKYKFKTKWGVMAVRGTEFALSEEDLYLLEGSLLIKLVEGDNFIMDAVSSYSSRTGEVLELTEKDARDIRLKFRIPITFFKEAVLDINPWTLARRSTSNRKNLASAIKLRRGGSASLIDWAARESKKYRDDFHPRVQVGPSISDDIKHGARLISAQDGLSSVTITLIP